MEKLNVLSEKLGVAVEHLWAVLIKQAPISGAFDLLFVAVVIAMGFATAKLWTFVVNKVLSHEWDESALALPIISTVVVFFLSIFAISGLSTTFAAFFNPEYWALQQVLSAIK